MNPMMVAGALFLAFGAGQAMAQNCTSGTLLQSPEITTLVANRYACVGSFPTAQWNELHSGSNVLDYKKGPTDPVDPSDTATNPTGTFAVTGGDSGTITYTYGSSAYGYNIRANGTGTGTGTGTLTYSVGTYSFCGVSGGAPNLLVTIAAAHC
jgi:hypothetical protein